jgi:hypothetical protein
MIYIGSDRLPEFGADAESSEPDSKPAVLIFVGERACTAIIEVHADQTGVMGRKGGERQKGE